MTNSHKLLDISPTTQVLVALTRTPITPLDAISELIDNAIDSFRAAESDGRPIAVRQIILEIPGPAEINRGEGQIRIRDTGPGLTEEHIANAMRAGYSDKNHFDTLGLFGMGFNIATGKLGRTTKVISARAENDYAIEVILDLPKLLSTGTFEVEARQIPKPPELQHGTVIEIRGWWPSGDANSGFILDLAKIPKKALRERIGRRYATLLRSDSPRQLAITVNKDRCESFEHCVWSEERFVEHRDHGRIPAKITFDQVVDRSRRCLHDGAEFGDASKCPRCERSESREIVQRIRGWVGIQRFDSKDSFGIDLIRNGRCIRTGERAAFFYHTDELSGRSELEYPVDAQYGRIVGEVHLDQVPVDFQKQNFQQATTEWETAMQFLRGGSLLPSKWKDEEINLTPVSRLFQGYRRVRNIGRGDMYMGTFNRTKGKADRISREVEQEYYREFLRKTPGYYDDAKWWELVETANQPPLEQLPECRTCGFQNPNGAESCTGCGEILDGKQCVADGCGAVLAKSATTCPTCGKSQLPKITMPWSCRFCDQANGADDAACTTCGSVKGAPHPASPESLAAAAEDRPELSAESLSIRLADGTFSAPLKVVVRAVHRKIIPSPGADPVPLVVDNTITRITVFVDLDHTAFTGLGLRSEFLIAAEVAQFLHALHSNLRGRPGHTIATITALVLREGWGDSVAEDADAVRGDIKRLFADITEKVLHVPGAADFYSELDESQQRAMAESLIESGVDLTELNALRETGGYLAYCDRETLAGFFARHPQGWFDKRVWGQPWPREEFGEVVAAKLRENLRLTYLRCMEDAASYLRYEQPEALIVTRARAAVEFLSDKLA
ncbi:ATP-binding protein [Streptomyces sp. HUAS TT11]|uniref:ATP-binding protein n=1 Tax=Streptomyces sp. HUAS TT11 TaxID=3447508 RepID=UPI003F657356